eukprot:TRINITY_DN20885_c0_g1_i1.p1 TRINITY_DN20885_c0_g1~~TRINITY_DN20885_c0_g1_i1.p1  ORF type:complete len:476 (+),score=155.62 TRINITY_DN20885_c0_g1_i1:101-1429(+)
MDGERDTQLPEWARFKIQKLEESIAALLQQIETDADKGPTTVRRREEEERDYVNNLLKSKRVLEQKVLEVQSQLDVLRETSDPMPMAIATLEQENAELRAQLDALRSERAAPMIVGHPKTPAHGNGAADHDADASSHGKRRRPQDHAYLLERISFLEAELRERDRESHASASPAAEKLGSSKQSTSSIGSKETPKPPMPSAQDGRTDAAATRTRATSLQQRCSIDEHAMERIRLNLDNTITKVALMLRQLTDTEKKQAKSKSKNEAAHEHITTQKKMLTGAYHDLAVSKQLLGDIDAPERPPSAKGKASKQPAGYAGARGGNHDGPMSLRGASPRGPSSSRRSAKTNVPPLSINDLRMSGRSPRPNAANAVLSPKQGYPSRGVSPAFAPGEVSSRLGGGRPDRKKGSSSKHRQPLSARRSHPSTPTTGELGRDLSRQLSTAC